MDPQFVVERLLSGSNLFWMIAGLIAIVAITFGTLTAMVKSIVRERTRREIAAYIAEGSMTPEQGERLMAAGEDG
jgi:hypothetical protein